MPCGFAIWYFLNAFVHWAAWIKARREVPEGHHDMSGDGQDTPCVSSPVARDEDDDNDAGSNERLSRTMSLAPGGSSFLSPVSGDEDTSNDENLLVFLSELLLSNSSFSCEFEADFPVHRCLHVPSGDLPPPTRYVRPARLLKAALQKRVPTAATSETPVATAAVAHDDGSDLAVGGVKRKLFHDGGDDNDIESAGPGGDDDSSAAVAG